MEKPQLSRLTLLILIAACSHYLLVSVIIPPWEGQDEPMHYEYVEVVRSGYLPSFTLLRHERWWNAVPRPVFVAIETAILTSMKEFRFWQINELATPDQPILFSAIFPGATALNQAPLYYLICAGVVSLFPVTSVISGMYICRLISLVFWLGTVYLTIKLAREYLGPGNPMSILPPILVIILPVPAMNACVVNNDSLAIFLATTIIYVMVKALKRGARLQDMFVVMVLSLLSLWTKRTTLSLIILILVFSVLSFIKLRGVSYLIKGAAIVVPLMLLTVFILMSALTGPIDFSVPASSIKQANTLTFFWNVSNQKMFFHYFIHSFWASFVWGHHFMATGDYLVLFGMMIVVLISLMWRGIAVTQQSVEQHILRYKILLLCIAAIGLQFGLVYVRFFFQIPTWNIAQGRFIFIALAPLVLVLSCGLQQLIGTSHRKQGCVFLLLVFVVFEMYVQARYVLPQFYMYYY